MLSISKFAHFLADGRRHGAPAATATNRPKHIVGEYLSRGDVVLDFDAVNQAQVFAEAARLAEGRHGLARHAVHEALCAREGFHSTALGHGVAIPHARIDGLADAVAMFVRTRHAIAFDAPDGKPVTQLLILLVPGHATERHLQILADAAQLFCERPFREQLAEASDAGAVCRLFAEGPRD